MRLKKTALVLLFGLLFIDSFGQDLKNDSLAKRRREKMDIMLTKPRLNIKTIGILLYNGYQTLDAIGPYETLSQLGSSVKVFFVAKQKGMISNQRAMKIQVDTSMDKVNSLDILVIPGGGAATFLLTKDTVVLNWIRKINQTSVYAASVCTGAWILGATGLLNGKKATTNWYRADEMLKRYGAEFCEARWVKDGKYWTSAGVTAGIDMSLGIINDLMGEKFTQAVMLNLEYDPQAPIKGGSVKNTEPIVKEMMEELYDAGILPLIQKQQKK